jgi:hypothetical protein
VYVNWQHETILFSSNAAQELASASLTQTITLPAPKYWPLLLIFLQRRR